MFIGGGLNDSAAVAAADLARLERFVCLASEKCTIRGYRGAAIEELLSKSVSTAKGKWLPGS